ncbi:MAG: hypothetical protein AAF149_05980 [Bacteroidota bacterium]
MSVTNRLVDIPKEFYSYSSGLPFERCIECDRYLLEGGTEYFIEKAIKQYDGFSAKEVIFEYAICANCADTIRKAISRKSMASIERYFLENVDFSKRTQIMSSNPGDALALINNCLVSQVPISEVTEYQIFAQCNGNSLNLSQMPYMVSGQTLEQIQHLLSSETRDELNDFMQRNLGPSPELAEVLPGSKVVII